MPTVLSAKQRGLAGDLAHFVSEELRQIEEEIGKLESHIQMSPDLSGRPSSSQLGIHTAAGIGAEDIFEIEVDFGGSYPIESVALVPAGLDPTGSTGAGYGFPRRFRIVGGGMLLDQEKEDFPSPGRFPVLFECGGWITRSIRLKISRHDESDGHARTALGELIAMSGGRNVALNRPVRVLRGTAASFPGVWQAEFLTDGHSILGAPVNNDWGSPSNGFLSQNAESADEAKWLQIDLGRSHSVDEISFMPARPVDVADTPGMGFPVRFNVMVGYDPTFREHQVIWDHTQNNFSNPGENPVRIPAGINQFRYVRLLATKLWESDQTRVLAMAEVRVFADNENIGKGAKVSVSDQFAAAERWAPEFLTDGYSSRHLLTDWYGRLYLLNARRKFERELARLKPERDALEARVISTYFWWSIVIISVSTVIIATGRIRARRAAVKATHQIRQQIATDLHDDVGSNLGSIALLAETGLAKINDPNLSEEKFREIVQTAQQTAGSMRDIVWMLKPDNSNTVELIRQMGAAVRAASEGLELELQEDYPDEGRPLPLDFTRNVFLICKESLNNVRRHAQATRLTVAVSSTEKDLLYGIADDGVGFDEGSASTGNGLQNLRDRAGSIGGQIDIQSELGDGTRIELRVPIP